MNYQKSIKVSLREKMKSVRDSLSLEEKYNKSQEIASCLLNQPSVINSGIVFCYVSFGSELQTCKLIEQLFVLNKKICVPKIISNKMFPVVINNFDQLHKSHFGNLEPIANQPIASNIDLCLTPGIAFTKSGKRLGYGKGYYDRFFAKHPKLTRIGLAFEIQVLADLPTNINDQLIDLLITEKGVINCQKQRNLEKNG